MAKLLLECCEDHDLVEYWHDNNTCGSDECYAVECMTCQKWQTLCGQTSSDTNNPESNHS
jgi:hypothetical protein